MRVSTHPTPNIRLMAVPDHTLAGPFDLWELERQAAGIEPGELATKDSLDFRPSVTDPIVDVLVVLFLACVGWDLYHSIRFLWEAAQ